MSAQDLHLATVMAQVASSLDQAVTREETLARITECACDTIPGVDFASISVRREDGELRTLAPTDTVTLQADALQYTFHEGPCYEAATEARTVSSPDMATDSRWPRYGPAAAELGLRSQLAVQFSQSPLAGGALNLYSRDSGRLGDQRELAELFAAYAGVAMGAVRGVEAPDGARTRAVVVAATGLVMTRYGISEERAFDFLIRASQAGKIALDDVAAEVVAGGSPYADA